MHRHIFRILAIAALALAVLGSPQAVHAGGVCRVWQGATVPPFDGSTWDKAFLDLTSALAAPCNEIWVAAGIYIPGANATDTFSIRPGQAVYGGFNATETEWLQRNALANLTILSGDIDRDDKDTDSDGIILSDGDRLGVNTQHIVTIDGTGGTPAGDTTILDGFTITAGDSPDVGGGLHCMGSGPEHMCSPQLSNLRFYGNHAATMGGAIYDDGSAAGLSNPVIASAVFVGNGTGGGSFGGGGAIYNGGEGGYSSPHLTDVYFYDNHSGIDGGAMFNNGMLGESSPTLHDVEFLNNSASFRGGAIFNFGGSDGAANGSSTPTITASLFRSNGANEGGAVYNFGANGNANATFGNVTFYANTANRGAAVYSRGEPDGYASPTFLNVTFSANAANEVGGALFNTGDALHPDSSVPTLTNVILWGDTAVSSSPEIYNQHSTPAISYSVVQGGCAAIAGNNCGTGNLATNPALGPLAYNGGPTRTLALLGGSSAIDAGDDSACAGVPIDGFDQRGWSRPQGTHCDIGAFEYDRIFADVPVSGKEWMERWIDAFYYAGITTGCGVGPLIYCPENNVTRAEMAVFLLRAMHGATYVPPAPTGVFDDVPFPGKEWMQAWIEDFYAHGITTGCGVAPLIYCPERAVTRAEMAVFVLRATHPGGWTPPVTSGIFDDVPVTGKEWMEPWIIEFYNEGITTGCGVSPLRYCPENNTTRAEMAVFIGRAYKLYP